MLSQLANASALELAQRPLRAVTSNPARRIGITGAPGAGKSTLLGHLALLRRAKGRLGVLAVDPSSPKTGGAILGDRVRMDELDGASELYIRSLGSRNTSDGLADNLPEMLDAMDDFGFAEVMLETVGVGQVEYAARAQVDTLVLVLLPDSGDTVQAMKAGIMEMADIFVVNKADLSGAQKMAADIQRIAALNHHDPGSWVPPVLLAAASQPASILALSEAIDRHQAWLGTSNRQEILHEQRARYRLRRLLEMRIAQVIAQHDAAFFAAPLAEQLLLTLEMLGRVSVRP
ncbi:MAG: methylmalonyl Co-A mutase-associated GTPase MeaB [Gammaproteobacteria bacterium]|nr:methylmalonyl Co-A mutase-associated GTPase MeaB [Gammaproteobacteria bacterium]